MRGPAAWPRARIAAFRQALLAFFEARGRDLPWRGSGDPYAVLVSEVMLQQTRVGTVIPYYRRWMEQLPNVEALAGARPDEVLKLWEGLGYYARARSLHQAAREVIARYDGAIPADPMKLRTLPGIGPYTAGAVASIAFGVPVPAVDGNVRRVLSRLADEPFPSDPELRRWGTALVDPESPGSFNQALMELGSLVCSPRLPACEGCPVARFCCSRAAGTQEERPGRTRPRPIPRIREVVAILLDVGRESERVLLRRRPESGLLGGMWELPGAVLPGDPREGALALARELIGCLGGVPPPWLGERMAALPPLDHAFSHRKVTYVPFLIPVRGVAARRVREHGLRWVAWGEVDSLPLPVAQRALLDQVQGS
jgi:A/G-specific adenine glycosylase